MFTEDELREALQHSAARVATPTDTRSARPADAPADVHPLVAVERPRHRRRWLLPAAAAAAVVALAGGVIAVARDSSSPHRTNGNPPAASRPAATSSSVATPRPLATVDVVDLAAVKVDADYQLGDRTDEEAGSETIRHFLGYGPNDGVMTVDVVPSGSIDAARVQQGKRVSIGGTTGWYSALKVYPLDANDGPGSDKWLPHWTIAFRTPHSDWAFAWIELDADDSDDGSTGADDVSVDNPAEIVRNYDRLGLRWVTDSARQPLRLTWLPSGLRMSDAMLEVEDGEVANVTLTFYQDTGGDKSLSVQRYLHSSGDTTPQCPAAGGKCRVPSHKKVAGGTVVVDGDYARAVRDRVLAGVKVATDPKDFVSLADAVRR